MFGFHIAGPGVLWGDPFFSSPAGSRSGLEAWNRSLDFGRSLEYPVFCWLLLGSFSGFSVTAGLGPSDPKDFSKVGVDKCLDRLQCRSCGSSCLSSKHQDRFYCGVEDSDFDVDGQVRLGPNVLHLKKGRSRSANFHFYIGADFHFYICSNLCGLSSSKCRPDIPCSSSNDGLGSDDGHRLVGCQMRPTFIPELHPLSKSFFSQSPDVL